MAGAVVIGLSAGRAVAGFCEIHAARRCIVRLHEDPVEEAVFAFVCHGTDAGGLVPASMRRISRSDDGSSTRRLRLRPFPYCCPQQRRPHSSLLPCQAEPISVPQPAPRVPEALGCSAPSPTRWRHPHDTVTVANQWLPVFPPTMFPRLSKKSARHASICCPKFIWGQNDALRQSSRRNSNGISILNRANRIRGCLDLSESVSSARRHGTRKGNFSDR